jgi:hypothetical protein
VGKEHNVVGLLQILDLRISVLAIFCGMKFLLVLIKGNNFFHSVLG